MLRRANWDYVKVRRLTNVIERKKEKHVMAVFIFLSLLQALLPVPTTPTEVCSAPQSGDGVIHFF